MHAEDVAKPTEYEPITHFPVSIARPDVAQYLPAGQGVHAADEVAPLDEKDPGEQRSLTAVRPVLLQNAPGSQSKHAS